MSINEEEYVKNGGNHCLAEWNDLYRLVGMGEFKAGNKDIV